MLECLKNAKLGDKVVFKNYPTALEILAIVPSKGDNYNGKLGSLIICGIEKHIAHGSMRTASFYIRAVQDALLDRLDTEIDNYRFLTTSNYRPVIRVVKKDI